MYFDMLSVAMFARLNRLPQGATVVKIEVIDFTHIDFRVRLPGVVHSVDVDILVRT